MPGLAKKAPDAPGKKEPYDWMAKFKDFEPGSDEPDEWKSQVSRTDKELELSIRGISNPKDVTEMGPRSTMHILEMLKAGAESDDDNFLEKAASYISGLLFKMSGVKKPGEHGWANGPRADASTKPGKPGARF